VKVISNSSPLINFAALGRFTLLRELYGAIVIPDAVYHEVLTAGDNLGQRRWSKRIGLREQR